MNQLRESTVWALLAAAYVLAAKAGLSLALVHANASAVWPPTGIALAALLVFGLRAWPGVFVGAFAANLTTPGTPLAAALGIACGNTLEALAGAWAVRRFAGGPDCFLRPPDTVRFALLAGLLSTTLSASIGVLSLSLTGAAAWRDFGAIWTTWWLGDAAGAVIVGPALLTWAREPAVRWSRRKALEAAAAAVLLLVPAAFVFATNSVPFKYLCLPALFWVAFRFGPRETATAVLALSVIGVLAMLGASAPGPYSPNFMLLQMQGFLGVVSVTAQVMSATVAQLRRNEEALRAAGADLEQRMAERTAELKGSEERYRALTQTANDAIISAGRDGRVLSWNDGAERLFGWSEPEALYRPLTLLMPERYRAEHTRGLERLAQTGKSRLIGRTLELHGLRRDGSEFPIELSLSAWRSRGEDYFTAIIRDTTERQRAQRVLEARNQDLLRSNAELEMFASVASHDLQEPLRKILLFGDRLLEKHAAALDAEGRDHLERMRRAAGRMSGLIEDLLQYSRVTMRAQPFEPVDLNAAARDALRDLESRVEESRAEVELGELPGVRGDPGQLRRLLLNLLSNALKFRRPDTRPRVALRGRRLSDGKVEFEVSDNGIGFDPKFLERIFKPFQRLHGRGEYEGTGMGLAICHKIVSRHGGAITARSAPGQGAAFVVTLPS